MPHLELLPPLPLPSFHRNFRSHTYRRSDAVLKASAAYLSHDHHSLLIECLTIEGHLRQSFFVLVTTGRQSTMVRLLPRTSPEKTPAVRLCLVWIMRWLTRETPGFRIGKTNLSDMIETGLPPEAFPS